MSDRRNFTKRSKSLLFYFWNFNYQNDFFFELLSAYLLLLNCSLAMNELAEISLLGAFSDHLVSEYLLVVG